MRLPCLLTLKFRPAIAGPTVSIWEPTSLQLPTGQPAIVGRSFGISIRTFILSQKHKNDRLSAHFSALFWLSIT